MKRLRPAPRLARRVLRNVLWPLALTWLLGSALSIAVATYLTNQAFDAAMLDEAHALAANVRDGPQGLEMQLSPREVMSVLFDQDEEVHYAVRDANDRILAGEAGLVLAAPPPGQRYRFGDLVFAGRRLRAVLLRAADAPDFSVLVAQTTRERRALVARLLLYALSPQLLLLLLLGLWLWRGVQRDLRPLGRLQQALAQRDAADLAPVPVLRTARELEGLSLAVNELFQRLRQSVQALREFTGNVAHELRTPLAGIRALAAWGLTQNDPAMWRAQLERIAQSEARASRLVDQLLALALADEARAAPQREMLRLADVVEATVLRHLAQADARGVDLGARGLEVGARTEIEANRALLEGVLDNLIDNALRYGGRTITVALEGTALSVIDDGPGLTPEARAALTQRWSQGDAGHRLGKGAGLGLAIVQRYAQLLGARFTLDADADSGGLCARIAFTGALGTMPASPQP